MKNKIIKYVVVVAILVCSILVLAGCENKKEETNATKKYTSENLSGLTVYTDEKRKDFTRYSGAVDIKFSYPSTWKNVSENEKQPIFVSTDETGAMLNLTTYLTDVTLEQLMEQSKKELEEKMKINGDIKQEFINLNGRKAGRVDYVLTNTEQRFVEVNENEAKAEDVEIDYHFTQIVFIDDKTTYILSVAVPVENYETVKDNVESILKSFSK